MVYHVSNDIACTAKGTTTLECQSGLLPFKYLGDWVGLEKKSCIQWKSLTDNIQMKLQGWKCRSLNVAERLVLTKSCLESTPNYWFSLQMIPKTVLKKIDGIRRGFFWEEIPIEGTDKRKMHTVRWELICSGKDKGGLNLIKAEE